MRKPERGMKIVMRRHILHLSVLALLCAVLPACSETRQGGGASGSVRSAAAPYPGASGQIPFPREHPRAFLAELTPAAQGLASWRDLEVPLANSLAYVRAKPATEAAISRPGLFVTWDRLAGSLERLRALLPELDANPALLERNFDWVRVNESIMYTGYYEPVIPASRTRTAAFSRPIYAVPPDMARHKKRFGSYHDRAAIDKREALRGKGLEMAWMNPVEAFFLQVQGSGRLRFADGGTGYVNYAAQNGHKYVSIGRIMREQGLLEEGNVTMPAIKSWLAANPVRQDEILFHNPSYVFFRWGTQPKGAMGFFVRPWVSLAVSRSFIPLGAVVAYGVHIPDPRRGGLALRGLGLAQDTGGAIKHNRIDIFCGEGPRAEYIAGRLDAQGEAWILLTK